MADGSDAQPVDIGRAMRNLGDDRELFDEVLDVFVSTIPSLLDELRSAMAEQDVSRLTNVAHGLKGSAANLCAEPTRQLAERLEMTAREHDFARVEGIFSELKTRLDELQKMADALGRRSVDAGPISS